MSTTICTHCHRVFGEHAYVGTDGKVYKTCSICREKGAETKSKLFKQMKDENKTKLLAHSDEIRVCNRCHKVKSLSEFKPMCTVGRYSKSCLVCLEGYRSYNKKVKIRQDKKEVVS